MCTGSHAYIPANHAAKLELIYDQDDQLVVNTFHAVNDQGWNASTLAQFCSLGKNWFDANVKFFYPVEYSLRAVRATDLTTQDGAVSELSIVPPDFGANTENVPLPNNVTVVIKWNTSKRGRSYSGRMFYPCLMDHMVAGNRLNSAGVSAVGTAGAGMLTAVQQAGWRPVVVSYCNNKAWRTEAAVTQIDTYSLNEVLDSQRRRLPERGR